MEFGDLSRRPPTLKEENLEVGPRNLQGWTPQILRLFWGWGLEKIQIPRFPQTCWGCRIHISQAVLEIRKSKPQDRAWGPGTIALLSALFHLLNALLKAELGDPPRSPIEPPLHFELPVQMSAASQELSSQCPSSWPLRPSQD